MSHDTENVFMFSCVPLNQRCAASGLPYHRTPLRVSSFFLLLLESFSFQQGEPQTHSSVAERSAGQVSGSWACSVCACVCVFPSEPSMFWLFVCQNKALSGFTHGVYCECARRIVRSGHARGRPMRLCWVKKWKLPVRELAGWQTRVRREVSDFPLTLSLLLCRGP